MSSYQVQLQIVDENGKCQKIYPINTSLDTIVGLVEPSLLLKLPGEKEDETLATSLSYIKAYLANLENVAAVKRNISSSTNLDDASTLATSKAVYTVQSGLSDANTEIENIKNKYAIKNHAVETKDYGIGTSLLYGHVKLSDTYDSEVTNGKASNGLAASQYAVFKAYEYLTKKAQDIADNLSKHEETVATNSVSGHVTIGDNISNTDGIISISKENVTSALGYTPIQASDLQNGSGIKIENTKITNTGVLSVLEGSTNGSLKVNTNGTEVDVPVHGLKSAAYTESSDYAQAGHEHDNIVSASSAKNVATTPDDYNGKLKVGGLKSSSIIGNPDSSTYAGVIGFRGYTDSTGGVSNEFAFTGLGRLFRRTGSTTSWNSWLEMVDSGNIGKFAPSLDGAGAIGNWNINAATTTKLANARTIALTGAVTGSGNFDGSNNLSIETTVNHKHTTSEITDFPSSLKNPYALTLQFNGTTQKTYDGSSAQILNITPSAIGASASNHTHNYAGSSSAGGSANTAVVLKTYDACAYNTTTAQWGKESSFFDVNGTRVGYINRKYNGDGSTVDLHIGADKGKVYVNNGYVAYADNAGNADRVDGKHATDFVMDKKRTLSTNDLNNANYPEPYVASLSDGTTIGLPGGWWHILYFRHQDNNGFGAQLAIPLDNNNAPRYRWSYGTTWQGWKTFITSDGGTIYDRIYGSAGGQFGTDGNVYINGHGYADWLTNILNGKLSTSASCNRNWNWSGQGGQPTWLWGGEDGTNMYVYCPANFNVHYATYASNGANNEFSCGYARMYHNSEGGNFRATAPNGVAHAEVDAWDSNHGRLYYSQDGVNEKSSIRLGSADIYLRLGGAPAGHVCYNGHAFYTTTSNKASLGRNGSFWTTLYARTGSINTSDRTKKHDIKDLTDAYEQLFLKLQPKSFIFNDGDRVHIGAISQDVEETMNELGIEPKQFAGFCKDIRYEYTEYEDDGTPIEDSRKPVTDEDGNYVYDYSLRYQEFIFLTIHMVQKLYTRVEVLEKENVEIKDTINEMKEQIKRLTDIISVKNQ